MKNVAKLQRSLYCSNLPQTPIRKGFEKRVIQHQIDTTDQQIDQSVYESYSLTDEEIRIVEDES